MKTTNHFRSGFTLIEILIVVAIILGLFAIILPIANNQLKSWRVSQVKLRIQQISGALEQYQTDNRVYPTNEQGLYALAFVPDRMFTSTTPGNIPGPGPFDPNSTGGSQSAGSELLNQPSQFGQPIDSTGTSLPNSPMPGTDPNTGMPIQGGALTDPITGQLLPDQTGGSSVIGGLGTTAWTYPYHNPQLYTQQQKRPAPYIQDKYLLDPWGTPYRYDNSRQYYGLNMTGTDMPAVWSAGPDKVDGTPDDILGWDADEAEQLIAAHVAQVQRAQQSGMMPTNPTNMPTQGYDPNNPMGQQFDLMNPNPIQPGPIQPGPIQPGPIQPGPIQPGPIQPGPIQPGPIQPGPIQPGQQFGF